MYKPKEKKKFQKYSKGEVIQRFKNNVDGWYKVSDDNSLWIDQPEQIPGTQERMPPHKFWAKKGLFDKQNSLLGNSEIRIRIVCEKNGFDLITGEYKGKCGDEMIAPSDCGEFTKLILGNESPWAKFSLGDQRQKTQPDPDPVFYKEEIIRRLVEKIGSFSKEQCMTIYKESKLVRAFIAPELITEVAWGNERFKDKVCGNCDKIILESKLLFDHVMEDQEIKEYVLTVCKESECIQGTILTREQKNSLKNINNKNYNKNIEAIWGMKKFITYLFAIKKEKVLGILMGFSANILRRVCTQSTTLFGFLESLGEEYYAPWHEQDIDTYSMDALKSMKSEQLEYLISDCPSLAKYLHVNQYAVPAIGEAYVISSGRPNVQGGAVIWPHHWAGVVMESEDKADKIVMENYYYNGQHNNLWKFDMVGTRNKKQTFHSIHRRSNQHGESPVTMAVSGKMVADQNA